MTALVMPFATCRSAVNRAAEASSGRSATDETAGVTTCAPVVRRRTAQTKQTRSFALCAKVRDRNTVTQGLD